MKNNVTRSAQTIDAIPQSPLATAPFPKRSLNKIEILAPGGGMDSVIAAVHSGADAVYIGAKQFSARASAHNFDEEELKECVRYCHQRGVDVHLALNTLIFDEEMEEALALVRTAAKADIDALIIQDLGLVSLVKKMVPDLPLHASTQLSVHTPYGAKALYEMGFSRVVLSRELSAEEIKRIHGSCPEVELEVFVHGALCMCLSGQCYFSAMLGGRSANRGMCAQPCRLPMEYAGNDHALSLKDNGSLHYLRELQEMGIASAKIEGRMKRPEYVGAATLAAREARDLGFITDKTAKRLQSVFSRTGFTDGFLRGEIGKEMFGYRQKSDVIAADSKLFKEIRSFYKDEYQRVPIGFHLTVETGEPVHLQATDGSYVVEAISETPAEKALHLPLTEERAVQSLQKTGNTPYYTETITTKIAPGTSVSAATLNALRRETIKKLDLKREVCHNYKINEIDIKLIAAANEQDRPRNHAVVYTLDLPDSLPEMDIVFADIFALDDSEKLCQFQRQGIKIGVEVPRAIFGNEDKVYERLQKLRERGVSDLLAHNIGAVYMGKQLGFTVHAGFGMNIANSYTLQWAKEYGIADAVASIELDLKRIERLNKCIPVGIIRYGYLPLMISRNTPAGVKSCKNDDFLKDRKNEKFPIVMREGACEILNCVPVLMPQKDYNLDEGVFSFFLFSVENSVEKMKKTLRKLRSNLDFERKTHGLYQRGVKKFTIF